MVLNHFKLIPEVWTIFLSPHAPVEPNPPPPFNLTTKFPSFWMSSHSLQILFSTHNPQHLTSPHRESPSAVFSHCVSTPPPLHYQYPLFHIISSI